MPKMASANPLAFIPETEHWAVITQRSVSIHHEADQRSIDHPGHGYPAYTETIESITYKPFDGEQDALDYIARNQHHSDFMYYRLLHVTPLKVKIKVVASA